MLAHVCDVSTGDAEARGWQVQGLPGLHGETPPLSLSKIKQDARDRVVDSNLPTMRV